MRTLAELVTVIGLSRDPRDRRREVPAAVAAAFIRIVMVAVGCLAVLFIALVIHG